jgi:hypothetical protein
MTDFTDYMSEFSPFLEYLMDEASGNLINSGGTAGFDLAAAGDPTYQAGNGYQYDSVVDNNYYVDFDGVGDLFHVDIGTALSGRTAGAFVMAFRSDVAGQDCALLSIHNEAGSTEYFKVELDTLSEVWKVVWSDGTNSRTVAYGDSNEYGMAQTPITHLLVAQHDGTNYTIWLDGVCMYDNTWTTLWEPPNESITDVGTPAGVWWNDMGGAEVLSVGGKAVYSAGSYSSSSEEFDGRIEYVGFFAAAFTNAQHEELWDRFVGGVELASTGVDNSVRTSRRRKRGSISNGPAEGLDTIRYVTAPDNSSSGSVGQVWLERCHSKWIARIRPTGASFTNPGSHQDRVHGLSQFTGLTATTDYAMDETGLGFMADRSLSSNSHPWVMLRRKGAFEMGGAGSTSGTAYNFRKMFIKTGTDGQGTWMVGGETVKFGAGPADDMWTWDGAATTAGQWNKVTQGSYLDTPITSQPNFGNRPNLHAMDATQSYFAVVTQDTSGDTVSTGGGGIHIYDIDTWLQVDAPIGGSELSLSRQTISGYTPQNNNFRGCAFFNDGTDDYLIVWGETIGGALGVTGQIDGIGILKRNSGTGTWTGTANLINNGSAFLSSLNGQTIATQQTNDALLVGNSLYVGYWETTPVAGRNYIAHLEWNGTYFAYIGSVPQLANDGTENPAIAQTTGGGVATSDEKGVVLYMQGTTPVDAPSNLHGYDRNPSNGLLTVRSTFFDGVDGVAAANLKATRMFGMTDVSWTENPDGFHHV